MRAGGSGALTHRSSWNRIDVRLPSGRHVQTASRPDRPAVHPPAGRLRRRRGLPRQRAPSHRRHRAASPTPSRSPSPVAGDRPPDRTDRRHPPDGHRRRLRRPGRRSSPRSPSSASTATGRLMFRDPAKSYVEPSPTDGIARRLPFQTARLTEAAGPGDPRRRDRARRARRRPEELYVAVLHRRRALDHVHAPRRRSRQDA